MIVSYGRRLAALTALRASLARQYGSPPAGARSKLTKLLRAQLTHLTEHKHYSTYTRTKRTALGSRLALLLALWYTTTVRTGVGRRVDGADGGGARAAGGAPCRERGPAAGDRAGTASAPARSGHPTRRTLVLTPLRNLKNSDMVGEERAMRAAAGVAATLPRDARARAGRGPTCARRSDTISHST
ncbi:unnamed protein product [Euphydryas editha]|uniref:Uncharacterized protein n=1 Tax=Euphydryas editha TaxID=104508 RepID=A0AAU9V9C6_EUPED|nr:unnamed protein product [Euphydryas editha]